MKNRVYEARAEAEREISWAVIVLIQGMTVACPEMVAVEVAEVMS